MDPGFWIAASGAAILVAVAIVHLTTALRTLVQNAKRKREMPYVHGFKVALPKWDRALIEAMYGDRWRVVALALIGLEVERDVFTGNGPHRTGLPLPKGD